jgi:tryptophan synthase alpha chain
MTTTLDQVFAKTKAENRAALIAYIPAGFPTIEGCKKAIAALIAGGVDAIEIGFPYSDPVMDGPIIQAAAERHLHRAQELQTFSLLSNVQLMQELQQLL